MAVAVVPGLFVAQVAAGRNEPVEHLGYVALQPRLKFHHADRRRAADGKDLRHARRDARGGHRPADLLGDVVHIAMAAGLQGELLLMDHGGLPVVNYRM